MLPPDYRQGLGLACTGSRRLNQSRDPPQSSPAPDARATDGAGLVVQASKRQHCARQRSDALGPAGRRRAPDAPVYPAGLPCMHEARLRACVVLVGPVLPQRTCSTHDGVVQRAARVVEVQEMTRR
jgi:hypothetical protein